MSHPFFDKPILNSPYHYPGRHWELDGSGQPTQRITERRRTADFITPIPKAKKQKTVAKQDSLLFDDGLSSQQQLYDHTAVINSVRQEVDKWRALKNPADWRVTPETARLLQHWRHHKFSGVRPFFCQVEAAETAIWLAEVAPHIGKVGQTFLDHLASANQDANPELMRLAHKLATGAGKTTVMAMLMAWQTVNSVRRPTSKKFTRGFLLVAPGLTIRDRLRVLLPNDPDSYFKTRELVPGDMMEDLNRAKIVITHRPEFCTVSCPDLVAAAREAGDAGFDVLIACAFNYDAHSSEFNKLGRIPVLKARMNADLHMAEDLKNTGKGNLFVIFGEPDTDYNEESFFVRHAYFLGANDPYKALKTTLKAEINEDAWATLNSDTSRPFDKPKSGRIAVKVINHLGDEVMKVFRV